MLGKMSDYWTIIGYYFMAVLMTLQVPVDGNYSCKMQQENVSCEKFYVYVVDNRDFLRRVGSSEKCCA